MPQLTANGHQVRCVRRPVQAALARDLIDLVVGPDLLRLRDRATRLATTSDSENNGRLPTVVDALSRLTASSRSSSVSSRRCQPLKRGL